VACPAPLAGSSGLCRRASGLKIDVIVRKNTAFDDSRFDRGRRIAPSENCTPLFAAQEDIVIMKMKIYKEGGSEKHLRDIAGILKISRDEVDRDYVAE
jgi:hypothetical protein